MAEASRERFHRLLKRDLVPLLRADGFKGGGTTFRRLLGNRIDIVNIQGSRSGDQCCVNLAAHFSFLPSEGGGGVTDPRKFKEYDCAFRDRLHEGAETDRWWGYGTTDAEAEASVASLVELYGRRGGEFFARFEPFPDVFDRIEPADIDADDLSKLPNAGMVTQVKAALLLARIMRQLGRPQRCREFADVGLRHLGAASALEAELKRLRDEA